MPAKKYENLSTAELTLLAWKVGELAFLMDANQQECWAWMEKLFENPDVLELVLEWSRQLGKSYLLCAFAIAFAIKNPGAQIKYAAPTAKMVKKIIRPHFRALLRTCPKNLQPRWRAADGEFEFPNGSVITVAGCDKENAENLRGQHAHLAIVDEAGFIDDLKYVIDDILSPQTLNTGGRIIIASTPAKTTGHPYKEICDAAREEGRLSHRDIYANPRITERTILRYKRKAHGGRLPAEGEDESTTWRREYLALHVTDEESAVVPEFAKFKVKVVRETVRPELFDAYAGMDVGWSPDFTGLLWGFWWFEEATLVIEHELLMRKMNTETLAEEVERIEAEFYRGHGRCEDNANVPQPYLRVSDTDLRLISDLSIKHRLLFVPTAKDDKDAAINNLRLMVQGTNGRLLIHPRCVKLIRQLENAVWNKTRTEFERSALDGHYDLVDALIYLARNIVRGRNPVPPAYRARGRGNSFEYQKPRRALSSTAQALARRFGIR